MSRIQVGDEFQTNEGYSCTVLEYKNCSEILVRIGDTNRHEKTIRSQQLKSGKVKNPYHPIIYGKGYYGVGDFKSSVGGSKTIEYSTWVAMFVRCYDQKRLVRQPTYDGCTVCKEWFDFQVFAEWFRSNSYRENGYALDKDILVRGNKVYSPTTCSLVPRLINSAVINREQLTEYPVGVSPNKVKGGFDAKLSEGGVKRKVGNFASASLAREAYLKAKEGYVRDLAIQYEGLIDDRVFKALIQWTV